MNLLIIRSLVEDDLLDVLSDPVASLSVLDMHELDANLVTVSLLICSDQISQLPLGLLLHNGATEWSLVVDLLVEVGFGKSIGFGIDLSLEFLVWESIL